MRRSVILTAIPLLLGVPSMASAQCIMCRTALATPEGQAMISAFQDGILLLIAIPFFAVGTIGYLAVRSQRRLAEEA